MSIFYEIDSLEETIYESDKLFNSLRDEVRDFDSNCETSINDASDIECAYIQFMNSILDIIPDGLPLCEIEFADSMAMFGLVKGDLLDDVVARLSGVTDGDTVQALLDSLSPIDKLDKIVILNIIYNAPPSIRSLILLYVDKIDIQCINSGGVFVPLNSSCGRTPGIYFNLAEDRVNPRGPFYTFFHEIGHMIDYWFGVEIGTGNFFSSSHIQFSEQLFDALTTDVRSKFDDVANQIIRDLMNEHNFVASGVGDFINQQRELLNQAIEEIMAGNRIVYRGQQLTEAQRVQLYLQNKVDEALVRRPTTELPNKTWYNMNTVSDTFAGMTNSSVTGTAGDRRRNRYHYWFDINGNPTNFQQMEIFAGVFSNMTLHNDDAIANINHYLPEASGIVGGIIDYMSSRTGGG